MDIYSSNWNEDDGSNSSAAPDGAPEGMAASGVNNVLRAHQGAIKRYVNQQSPKTTAGSPTAFTLTYTVAPDALVDAMTHLVQFNAANGNAPTLNINGLGATPIYYYSADAWRAVPAALWGADTIFRLAYHSSSGTYRILNRPDTTGDWVLTGRSTARGGTLLAYGQAISRTAYAGLFAAYSTTYGVGDGSTTFNLPDLRGRVAAGKDDMGGAAASRLSGGTVLGAGLGTQTATTGSVSGSTSNFNAAAGADFVAVQSNTAFSSVITSTVQPTIIANYAVCL
jgi:microcystin-dependent protein